MIDRAGKQQAFVVPFGRALREAFKSGSLGQDKAAALFRKASQVILSELKFDRPLQPGGVPGFGSANWHEWHRPMLDLPGYTGRISGTTSTDLLGSYRTPFNGSRPSDPVPGLTSTDLFELHHTLLVLDIHDVESVLLQELKSHSECAETLQGVLVPYIYQLVSSKERYCSATSRSISEYVRRAFDALPSQCATCDGGYVVQSAGIS